MTNRLKSPVTYFDTYVNTKPSMYGNIGGFLERVRDHNSFIPELRNLKVENEKEFSLAKKKLPGICFGKFSKRNDKSCETYSPCLGFDIDKIKSQDYAMKLLEQLKKLNYVFVSFLSVSGLGIRVLVWTSSTKEQHKEYYSYILKLIRSDIGEGKSFEIDTSTKNISRLWFYSSVQENEFYINEKSKVITIEKSDEIKDDKNVQVIEDLSESQKINLCEAIIQSRSIHGRNNRTMEYVTLSSEHGINQKEKLKTL